MSEGKRDEVEGKFEKVLDSVGSSGRYQHLLLWLLLAPLNFMISWIALGSILLTAAPAHWCDVPGRPDDISVQDWLNATVPRETDGTLSKCQQYNTSQFDVPIDQRETINCQWSYAYSTEYYTATLTSRHNWVCEDSSTVALWQSVGIVGNLMGTFFFNPLSDIFGRRALFVTSAVVHGVMGVVRVLVQPFWLIMLTQFIASLSFPPILEISLVLVYELVNSSWRSRVTSVSYASWSLGTCGLALAAYLARTDTVLSIIISVPFLVYVPAMRLIPESPRWLLTRGKIDEAENIMRTIAKINKKDPPENLRQQLQEISLEKQQHHGAIDLLKTRVLANRMFLLTSCYVLNNIFYYGLAYNTANLNGNDFINFFLLGITELPGNIVGWWVTLNLGRRLSQTLAFLMGSVILVVVLVVGEDASPWLNISLLTFSKFFIAISYLAVYLLMAELYPTSHCVSGIGVASVVASSVGVAAPYIAYSAKEWWGLPYVILLLVGLTGCLVSSFLPETLGSPIPQTLEEAEVFLTKERYFSYRGKSFWKCGRGEKFSPEGKAEGITNEAFVEK